MDPTCATGLQFAPAQTKLSPYDTPTKPDQGPRAKAQQAVQDEVSHPFNHYLAQFVPGLLPHLEPLKTPEALQPADKGALALLARSARPTEPIPQGTDPTLDPLRQELAVPAFAPQGPTSQAPIEPARKDQGLRLSAVRPTAIPQMIRAQVQRMQTDGIAATQIRVQLDPPDLGKLQLAFTYAQQRVSVNVVAATQAAKDHLDAQLGAIRGILGEHNLQTGELKVVLGGKNGPQGGSTDRDGNNAGQSAASPLARRRKRPNLDEDLAIDDISVD